MDNGTDTINPDWRNAVSRRIVEVTDDGDNLFLEFIELKDFEVRGRQWA
jgi:hypothetical protein